MDHIQDAITRRDLNIIVGLFFDSAPGGIPALRAGFRRETELWDFKRGLPGLRAENDRAWAGVAADLAGFHNRGGGILFFGVTDDTFAFVGTRDPVDAKRFNDKVRRYLGDKVWVEFAREFIGPDQRYLGIAVIPGRGVNPLRFVSDSPAGPDGTRLFSAGDLSIREGDQTRILRGSDAESFLARNRLPSPDARFLVRSESARILRPDWDEFVERDELCAEVRQGLIDDRTYVTTLTGVGGVGKTALACWAVIEAYREGRFGHFVSVSAKDRTLSEAGIRAVQPTLTSFDDLLNETLRVLGFPEYCGAEIEEREAIVRQLLSETNALLFVDNLETVEDRRVVQFLETLPKPTKAITTSRTTPVRRAAYPITVGPFTVKEGLRFFDMHARRRGKDVLLQGRPAEKERIAAGCSNIPLAIEWVIGQAVDLEAALAHAEALAGSGTKDEELLEFCFRRVHTALTEEARGLLEALAVVDRPQVLEAAAAASGHSLEVCDGAIGELEAYSLVERVWDPSMHDFAFRMLPLTRRFAYRELQRHVGEEKRIRGRLSDWFEGKDVPDEGRALIVASRRGRKDPEAALVDAAIDFRRQGRVSEAEKYFLQAIERNPKSWRAHREYAELLRDQDSTGAALEHYEIAAANAPVRGADRALVSRELGMLLRQSGYPNAHQRAIEQFETALRETPHDPIVAHALASCHIRQGHYRQAQPLLEKLLLSRSAETRARSYDLLDRCYGETDEKLKRAELRDRRSADREASAAQVRSKRSVETSVRPLVKRGNPRPPRRRR
jgi:tetratricopeptide (TPR) repeat protein